jgi:ribosomal-protein-alanine N-acetyltransferase
MEPVIRPAAESDVDAISIIENDVFPSRWSRENIILDMQADFSMFAVAEQEGEIIGYVSAWNIRGEVQLNRLAVKPACRRKGTGRALAEYIIGKTKEDGAVKIFLEVRERNTEARQFYKCLGFIETGLRKNYYGDDHAVLMDKQL